MTRSVENDRFQLVLTTAGSPELARKLARGLVERRLAACVNVLDLSASVYRWNGEIVEEPEKLLLIKTERRLLEPVRQAIRQLHDYEVPEVIAVPIRGGDETYLAWLAECLDGAE